MRLLRGRAGDHERDHQRTRELVDRVGGDAVPALRVWRPHRQVAFGRRDRRRAGYERAREAATEREYAVLEREVGGRAVAYTGNTVAFALAEPSFCPGAHSLQATGKLVGIAQRVRQDVALTAGVVVVRDHAAIAAVLDPVYDALGLPFDPDSVGSVVRAGGDGEGLLDALETELAGRRPVTGRDRIRDT